MRRSPEHREWRILAPAILVGLGLMACSDDSDEANLEPVAQQEAGNSITTSESVTVDNRNDPSLTLVFDYLGVGSQVIEVYNGPGDTDFDREAAGTYFDGDSETAVCIERGRPVASPVGAVARNSILWAGLDPDGDSVPNYYGSLVYFQSGTEESFETMELRLQESLDPC